MAHYARIEDGSVTEVIVADAEFIASQPDPKHWVQTSYNTRGGVHYGPDGAPDGGEALRGNFAGVGFVYDAELDMFYPPQPFPSWTLNPTTATWEPPVPMTGNGGPWVWDEASGAWRTAP